MVLSKRILLVLVLLGLLVFSLGCGGNEKPNSTAAPDESSAPDTVTVYFFRDDGNMEPVSREVALDEDTPEARLNAAVNELLKGPSSEQSGQLFTQLPEGVKLLGVEIEPPYATLDFSAELENMGGSARVFGVLDQLVYTATELDGVDDLILKMEGEQVGTTERPFTGDGLLFDSDELKRPDAGQ